MPSSYSPITLKGITSTAATQFVHQIHHQPRTTGRVWMANGTSIYVGLLLNRFYQSLIQMGEDFNPDQRHCGKSLINLYQSNLTILEILNPTKVNPVRRASPF
jgi:hypothetical protein